MSEQAVDNGTPRNDRKVREGLVVSDKMDKTVVVSVEDRVKHALYGKVMRRTSKLISTVCLRCSTSTRPRVFSKTSRPLNRRWHGCSPRRRAAAWS